MKYLSKSQYMSGLEGDAYLWLVVNRPDRIPEPDFSSKDRMEQGIMVERTAKSLYDGFDLSSYSFEENVGKARALMNDRVLFEPVFVYGSCYCRCDVLVPVEDGFDLIEVKSSARVKDKHLVDLAFQRYVLEGAGVKIRNYYVMHLNNKYVKGKELDLNELFSKKDVSEEVRGIDVSEEVEHMLKVIDYEEMPDFDVFDISKSDYGNVLIDEFYEKLPECSVFDLYSLNTKEKCKLYDEGIVTLDQVPFDFELTAKQRVQVDACRKGEVLAEERVKDFLYRLEEPVIHLDFEAFQLAIPEFEGTSSYEQIPFQYSMHIERESLEHKEFLYDGNGDPRKDFIESLKENMPEKGSILVYHKSFENTILKKVAKAYPEYKEFVEGIVDRVVDLKTPFANFWYYHKDQRGSNSIKKVLPIFSEENHKDLEISDGQQAMITYRENRGNLSNKVKEELLEYCKLDTYAMVEILNGLRSKVNHLS